MAAVREVRIFSIAPEHPPRVRSASTMGVPTREDGAKSTVRINIDLGLKNNTFGRIEMSTDEAVAHATTVLVAAGYAIRANAEFDK